MSSPDPDVTTWSDFPGAVSPLRTHVVDSWGLGIRVIEWGDEDAPILLLAHGGADFARTFDVFGPLLAAGGYRVVSWDHRSHGDSPRAPLQSWDGDRRDALAVLDSCLEGRPGDQRVFAVGHSKGGGLMTDLCAAYPDRFVCLVNIDGVPSHGRERRRDGDPSPEERVARRQRWTERMLAFRRGAHDAERRPGTTEELVDRRAAHNPRLSREWLRYLVTVGAREDADGWRWKLDPTIRMFGMGPWRPSWGITSLRSVTIPTLAILGRVQEPMGWGTQPEEARRNLPDHALLEVFEDSGHFVHVEHPGRTAERVLTFLGEQGHRRRAGDAAAPRPATDVSRRAFEPPPPGAAPDGSLATVRVTHGMLDLALHRLHAGDEGTPALLCVHGLGEEAGAFLAHPPPWPGPVWALDLSGHGASARAAGGGYSPEMAVADLDVALARLGSAVVLGRGLGAYLALQLVAARPEAVPAAVLSDGPGLRGGGPEPAAPVRIPLPEAVDTVDSTADPLALAELSADIRPPGYAALFPRQVRHLHPHATEGRLPIWWAGGTEAASATPWLAEVLPGLQTGDDVAACLQRVMELLTESSDADPAGPRGETAPSRSGGGP